VANGVLSAIRHLVEYSNSDIVFPESIDEEFILNLATLYLGEVFCNFVDYKPTSLQFNDLAKTKEQFD